jgi:hypothetical protein
MTGFIIARARASAAFGRGCRDAQLKDELRRLQIEGERLGIRLADVQKPSIRHLPEAEQKRQPINAERRNSGSSGLPRWTAQLPVERRVIQIMPQAKASKRTFATMMRLGAKSR